ncbi:unnamed protein product [Auanema sp. JU1783]|nr:unnamed protein product [Auanema sp. JU1783]
MAVQPNFSQICLTDTQQRVHGTELEYMLQRYVYPCLAVIGIFGNFLNLTVLLNRNMRSRANSFLSVLAFADIIFLSLLFPNILANYEFFTFNYYFRWFYFNTKVHLLSLANWCSAVAIWCVIAVCADRLVGIRSPLYTRSTWSKWKLPALITTIVVVSGCATFYQHFEYDCPLRSYCQHAQLYSRCLPVTSEAWFGNRENPYSHEFRKLISLSVLIYVFLMIIFPIVLLTILNLMLLCALRKRQKHLQLLNEAENSRRANENQLLQKTEHRVTLTVTFIVTMFTLTNGPSALIHLIRTTYHLQQHELYDLTMICSTLVICGKASNFILFCLGSKHFRLRLMKLTQKKMNKKIDTLTTHLLPSSVSRAVMSHRQSVPSQKSSLTGTSASIVTTARARHSSTDQTKPFLLRLDNDF